MPRRYEILDVFTDRPLAGNPLAVVLDTEGLDGGAMQRIAREFNLSETVFVLPAAEPRAHRRYPHLHAGARASLRRPSDRRHGRLPCGAALRRARASMTR